ncbi:hypothetical protein [uncultured Allofournierella sp.]|uniref:hypothetical protein n=1 Tax=uncultured Allofournierella sp. TaxID=1940258 RepID=UPI0025F71E0F|nr:hypothetical protein [uncultured Fournierella sp.]
MELPIFVPMPPETAALLPVWNKAVVQAQDLEGSLSFSCPVVTSQNGSTLLLGLTQERTAAGRALVRALWFDQPVTLWLPYGTGWIQLTARAWKCHITGPVFRELLEQARRRDPAADLAVVWELLPTAQSSSSQPPRPVDCPLLREAEIHLELLRPAGVDEQ